MKIRTLALASAAVVSVAGATLFAQGFNVRTGTWEFTFSMQMSGPMPGISPELQKQLQAQMAKPQTSRSCISAEDLKSLNLGKMDDDDSECKTTSVKISPTVGDIVRQCTGDEARTETGHFSAPTPTTLVASINSKNVAGGTSVITMNGKWISADCKE